MRPPATPGYAAGHADLVLALMLTEQRRKVLQGLAEIAAERDAVKSTNK